MYFPEEDENKTYTVKEIRELLATRDASNKAKAEEELKEKKKISVSV